jgi:L-alanine-DL-glutamate epimerase-like enolase superfamily enzyme
LAALETCTPTLAEAEAWDIEPVLDLLEHPLRDHPAALTACEMALHDLAFQPRGLPVRRLWSATDSPLEPTAVSIGAGAESEVLRSARAHSEWPILKLKMTPGTDIHMVGRVRDAHGGRIWIDGNGSWDARAAIDTAEVLQGYGVELLEQPVPAGQPEVLGFVRARSPLPIVADEDCRGPEDVSRLQGRADVINVKLVKCGGLRRALRTINLARGAGLRVMLGCKTESVLGVTAMAQLAPLADYLDLDGHLGLANDPFSGISIDRGHITLPTAAGLGISSQHLE